MTKQFVHLVTVIIMISALPLAAQNNDYEDFLQQGRTYIQQARYPQAEEYLLKALSAVEDTVSADYASVLSELGAVYFHMGDFAKAEKWWTEEKAIFENALGKEHPAYASALINLGYLYDKAMRDFAKAEQYYLEGKTMVEKTLGKEHQHYATTLNILGSLYFAMGDYDRAISVFEEAKTIRGNILGKEHPSYAESVSSLGTVYLQNGEYMRAETCYLEAKTIREKVLGDTHHDYAASVNNLGGLHDQMGDYAKALTYYLEAKTIREKVFGKEHPNYAETINNLGHLYTKTGDYIQAETYLLEVKIIFETVLGKEHSLYAISLHNLGRLYISMGDYVKAKTCLLEAKPIFENVFGKKHINYAKILINTGNVCFYTGDYDLAETHYIEAKTIFDKKHPDVNILLYALGNLYIATKNFAQAQAIKIEADQLLTANVENTFSFLSERQRSLFWDTNKNIFETGYSYAFAQPENTIITHVFDNTLFTKGLLLRTTNGVRDAIYSSGDDDLIKKYDYLGSVRRNISALQARETPDHRMIGILETRTDSLDKALTVASATYRDFNDDVSVRWQNIRDVLQTGEAAIEFVHFRLHDGKRFTDSILYCALLLKKDLDAPAWIPLFAEKQLQTLTRRTTHNAEEHTQELYSGAKGDSLYRLIWKPLEKELQGVRRIYYSPSGMLHQIAFAAISVDDGDGKDGARPVSTTELLSDRYDLQLVSSTREIARLKNETPEMLPQGSAAIFGGLSYTVNQGVLIAEAASSGSPNSPNSSNFSNFSADSVLRESPQRGVPWDFLPGTEKEAEAISDYLNERKFPNRLYMHATGNEEAFKRIGGSPAGIIHLATHGYFFEDIENEYHRDILQQISGGRGQRSFENPLLRSGLLLAGSNRAWTGIDVIEGIEDGILTAEEISQMNLINTQLVVLSACETGLGEAKTAEGVFGLQRAFKLAGVETLIMSLWTVPDDATAELMIDFYQYWLSGKTKRDAFAEAQRKVREKYQKPYHWAGFVMMD